MSVPNRLLIGTGNKKKQLELTRFLSGIPGVPPILTLADLKTRPKEPEETGSTFEENALIKAQGYARATGFLCLADDSGLEVDHLEGRPGVHSARYSGENATDESNNRKILRELEGVPAKQRAARYVAVITLASATRKLAEARGTCEGVLLEAPRGAGGFGYDPLFYLPGLDKTFAELTTDEKSRISHRGVALLELKGRITQLFGSLRNHHDE